MEIILARPRGFCAGVKRAIEIVERVLSRYGAPVYVRHEVVHNRFVVEELKAKGAVFVEELNEVPDGVPVVFSAHGVPQSVRDDAQARGLTVFDATCPLVTKVHVEVRRWHKEGRPVVVVGHRGHPEVEGTMGQVGDGIHLVENAAAAEKLELKSDLAPAFVTQTTLSVDDARETIDALRQRLPSIVGPRQDDICYATQNRQDAVKNLARQCQAVLVVGSPNSSNSNRLREVAIKAGARGYLVDSPDDLDPAWLEGVEHLGLTAGASAPEILVEQVIARLRSMGAESVRELEGEDESTVFPLPAELR